MKQHCPEDKHLMCCRTVFNGGYYEFNFFVKPLNSATDLTKLNGLMNLTLITSLAGLNLNIEVVSSYENMDYYSTAGSGNAVFDNLTKI